MLNVLVDETVMTVLGRSPLLQEVVSFDALSMATYGEGQWLGFHSNVIFYVFLLTALFLKGKRRRNQRMSILVKHVEMD